MHVYKEKSNIYGLKKIDLSWKSNRNLELTQFYNKFGFAVRVWENFSNFTKEIAPKLKKIVSRLS